MNRGTSAPCRAYLLWGWEGGLDNKEPSYLTYQVLDKSTEILKKSEARGQNAMHRWRFFWCEKVGQETPPLNRQYWKKHESKEISLMAGFLGKERPSNDQSGKGPG